MRKTILILLLTVGSWLIIHAQNNTIKPVLVEPIEDSSGLSVPNNTDSIQKVQIDSINNLIQTKLLANADLLIAAETQLKKIISADEYEKSVNALHKYQQVIAEIWLELYRREQLKKQKK